MSDVLFKAQAPRMISDLLRDFPQLEPFQASAAPGNGGTESGGFTQLQEIKPTVAGSRGGFGWFQWTGPRRRAFEAYCKGMNYDPASYEANYGFLVKELRSTERAAITALCAATTLEDAVRVFEAHYERAGVKNYASRIRYARIALDAWVAVQASLGRDAAPAAPAPKPGHKTVEIGPLKKSRTMAGGSAATIGGAAEIAKTAQDQLQQVQDSISTGTIIGYAIGSVVLVGGLLAIYARWDMTGRPLPSWWPHWLGGRVA